MNTRTTTTLRLPARVALRAFLNDYGLPLAAAALLLAFVLGATLGRLTGGAVVIVQATPTLAALPAHNPQPVEVARDERPRLVRSLIAYAAPAGDALGAVDAGRAYAVEGRAGDRWALLRVDGVGGFDGRGAVWVNAGDLAGTTHAPELATPTPPPATPQPDIVYVSVAVPAVEVAPATPAPTLDIPPGPASTLPEGVDPLANCCWVNVRLEP